MRPPLTPILGKDLVDPTAAKPVEIYPKKIKVFISDTPQQLGADINEYIDRNLLEYTLWDLEFQIIYYQVNNNPLPNVPNPNLPIICVALATFISNVQINSNTPEK